MSLHKLSTPTYVAVLAALLRGERSYRSGGNVTGQRGRPCPSVTLYFLTFVVHLVHLSRHYCFRGRRYCPPCCSFCFSNKFSGVLLRFMAGWGYQLETDLNGFSLLLSFGVLLRVFVFCLFVFFFFV